MALIMERKFDFKTLLVGKDRRFRFWQAGGIGISFGTDILMLLAGGAIRGIIC